MARLAASCYHSSTHVALLLFPTTLLHLHVRVCLRLDCPPPSLPPFSPLSSGLPTYPTNVHARGWLQARDWARFGLLFLKDGVWVDGERVLPEGWVEYSKTGSAADPGYGRHWRLDNGARARCML